MCNETQTPGYGSSRSHKEHLTNSSRTASLETATALEVRVAWIPQKNIITCFSVPSVAVSLPFLTLHKAGTTSSP